MRLQGAVGSGRNTFLFLQRPLGRSFFLLLREEKKEKMEGLLEKVEEESPCSVFELCEFFSKSASDVVV